MAGWITQDYSGAEKANTSHDPLHHSSGGIGITQNSTVGTDQRNQGRDRGAQRNETVRPQAGGLSVQLTVQSDGAAENDGNAETQHGVFISGQHNNWDSGRA